jgi:hypothetical protein
VKLTYQRDGKTKTATVRWGRGRRSLQSFLIRKEGTACWLLD